jgi:catechol 2,3-dioxygenase
MTGDDPQRALAAAPRDPEELEAQAAPSASEISATMTLGEVSLTVSDLARSTTYYESAVGLQLIEQADGHALLGVAGRGLLRLTELAGARPVGRHTGLYHFALLLERRADLANWLSHAARDRVALVGLSDHFVSEALYLSDPDGHGIEIYWDRPREIWEGQVAARMTTLPLDVDSLLGEVEAISDPYTGLTSLTVMGHVHLKVAAIPETVAFYRDALGFGLMAQLGAEAAFLSASAYHHHIGANVWESAGAAPPPPDEAALRHFTIVLPDQQERDGVVDRLTRLGHAPRQTAAGLVAHDPSGNQLVLATSVSASAPNEKLSTA